MEPNEIAKEQNAKANELELQGEPDGSAESANTSLSLDDLDVVAGGAGGAGFVEADGQVVGLEPNGIFSVQLDDGSSASCKLSGKLRMLYVRVYPGDRVRVETGTDSRLKGRIVWVYR